MHAGSARPSHSPLAPGRSGDAFWTLRKLFGTGLQNIPSEGPREYDNAARKHHPSFSWLLRYSTSEGSDPDMVLFPSESGYLGMENGDVLVPSTGLEKLEHVLWIRKNKQWRKGLPRGSYIIILYHVRHRREPKGCCKRAL